MSNPPDAEDKRAHKVYRCYDRNDVLLYVGCSRDLEYRFGLHHPLVIKYTARVATEDYPDRLTGRAAERDAIRTEAPVFNKQHNPTRFRKVKGGSYQAVEPVHPLTEELVAFDAPVSFEDMRTAMRAFHGAA